jgi:hypothetical protein
MLIFDSNSDGMVVATQVFLRVFLSKPEKPWSARDAQAFFMKFLVIVTVVYSAGNMVFLANRCVHLLPRQRSLSQCHTHGTGHSRRSARS